jgi:hypothetical protein
MADTQPAAAKPRKPGRPSTYNDKVATAICERIAGGESLHKVVETDGMPAEGTVYRWLNENAEFREQYTRARERAADRFAAEILEIADSVVPRNMLAIEKARIRIDARKWSAGKMAPKKYSDKFRQEITGADGGPLVVRKASEMTDDELAALIAGRSV